MVDILKMRPGKRGAARKPARRVKSNQQKGWRMWAVGRATAISGTCVTHLQCTYMEDWGHYTVVLEFAYTLTTKPR
jgi:hypothetical protein